MNIFKKSRHFIAGILVGAIITVSVPVLADNELVSVMVDRSISMIIAGESKTLPSDYEVLNYKGYTYLPSRYVAEELGSTVSWDEGTRTIIISEPPVKEVEKIVEVPVEVEKVVYVDRETGYSGLPASMSNDGVQFTVTNINLLNVPGMSVPSARVYVEVRNESGSDISIDYFGAAMTVDGSVYKTSEFPTTNWSGSFIDGTINYGRSTSSYFEFMPFPSGTHNFILTIPYTLAGSTTKSLVNVKFSSTITGGN